MITTDHPRCTVARGAGERPVKQSDSISFYDRGQATDEEGKADVSNLLLISLCSFTPTQTKYEVKIEYCILGFMYLLGKQTTKL